MVVTVNVADLAPAGMVTLAGTTALVLLDVKVTAEPPVGAGPLRVTVPVEDIPPTTEVGDTAMDVRDAALTVKTALTDAP